MNFPPPRDVKSRAEGSGGALAFAAGEIAAATGASGPRVRRNLCCNRLQRSAADVLAEARGIFALSRNAIATPSLPPTIQEREKRTSMSICAAFDNDRCNQLHHGDW